MIIYQSCVKTFLPCSYNRPQNVLLPTRKCTMAQNFNQAFLKPGRNVFTLLCLFLTACRKHMDLLHCLNTVSVVVVDSLEQDIIVSFPPPLYSPHSPTSQKTFPGSAREIAIFSRKALLFFSRLECWGTEMALHRGLPCGNFFA